MSLEHLQPYAGSHAIQQAVFTLEWESELSIEQIRVLKELANQSLISSFPSIKDQNTVTFSFGITKCKKLQALPHETLIAWEAQQSVPISPSVVEMQKY